jgi:endonuclease-3
VKYQAFNKFTLLTAMKKNIKIEVKPEKDEGEKKKSGLERATTISDAGDLKLREKVQKILSVLNHYYPNPPIPLDHSNDFTFLVAVVLSAQTTDGKVNEVTKELFKLADTPEKMSKLEIPFVQQIIQPVGLAPRKASFIVNLSKLLIERHGGKVPGSYEELENLPGVGHKTASVIMSQLFGENSFAVDTHVHRLALRWGLSKEEKNVDKVQKDLCRAFPEETWNKVRR